MSRKRGWYGNGMRSGASSRISWKYWDGSQICKSTRLSEVFDAANFCRHLLLYRIHVISGLMPAGREFADMERVYLDNLTFACKRLAQVWWESRGSLLLVLYRTLQDNINCLIEPINAYTRPGYFMSSVDRGNKRFNGLIKLSTRFQPRNTFVH